MADTLQVLAAQLEQDRVLLPAQQSVSSSLALVGKSVLKIDTEFHSGDMRFNWSRNTLHYQRPLIRTSIAVASEVDILDAQRSAEQDGSGADRVLLRKFLELVRAADQPAEPLRTEVVNAEKIGADRVLTIKRGDDGKMTSAVVQSLT
jgi:hypothetical protein